MSATSDQSITYQDRLDHLREKKLEQTQEKIRRVGYMNEDDYGLVLPPEDFSWEIIPNHSNGSFYGLKGWSENFCSLIDNCPTYVDPMDALAGRYRFLMNRMRPFNWPPELNYDQLVPEQKKYGIIHGIGDDQHLAPDLEVGLSLGWEGLLEKVRHYKRQHDAEKTEFFEAEEKVIIAIQNSIQRHVEANKRAEAAEVNTTLRENLHAMAEVNAWLIQGPPLTFREACQWLAWFSMASRTYNRDGAGGQLDELLRPYYERDVRDDILDDEEAIFTLACLFLIDTRYHQLGGPDADGNDQTSHPSFLILEAAHRLKTTCNLTIRVHEGLNPELFRRGVEYLLQDRKACPRFSGNNALVEGFMRNGYPASLARKRIAVGCNWMALPGLEYTMNDTVKINVAKVFEIAFNEMMEDPDVAPHLDSLWQRFENYLRKAVLCTMRGIDVQLDHQHENEPELLLNLLCHQLLGKRLQRSVVICRDLEHHC